MARRGPSGLHRPARLVRGLSAGRRLDRPRSDLGPARGRRSHSAGLHARARRRRAGHRRGRRVRSRVRAPHDSGARLGSAARHQAVHRRAVEEIESLGHAIDARPARGRRAPHDGRRAHVRLDRRSGWRRSGIPPRSGRQAPPRASSCIDACKRKYAPQGLVHFGQGKWYPGEPLPRWSLNCFWRRDGEPIWKNPACSPTRRRIAASRAEIAQRFPGGRRANGSGLPPEYRVRGLRGRLLLPVARAAPAGERRSVGFEARRPGGARASGARVRARVWTASVGHVLPLARATAVGERWQTGAWFLRASAAI